MNRLTWALALTLPLALVACGEDDDDSDDTAVDDTGDAGTGGGSGGTAPDAFSDCSASDGDGTDLANAAITGDTLTIEASYGGGCETHEFQICWDQLFLESEPVQVGLEVWHDANGDSCEAYLSETLSFDLAPLKQAWQDGYQQESGTITIHTDGGSVAYTF
jgi:hypothetical protein